MKELLDHFIKQRDAQQKYLEELEEMQMQKDPFQDGLELGKQEALREIIYRLQREVDKEFIEEIINE